MNVAFSILHATHRREPSPLLLKQEWLDRADDPSAVDYIFSMDGDDALSVARTAGHKRVIGTPLPGTVTSVRNWNAAAHVSVGAVLIVIADDLFPSPGWDSTLRAVIGSLDPLKVDFAIKIRDHSARSDTQLRHPIISRAYYRQYGLFASAYRGVYCDDDITMRSFWYSVILDGKILAFDHRRPVSLTDPHGTLSQRTVNQNSEYEYGRRVLVGAWSDRQRTATIRLVPGWLRFAYSGPTLVLFRWVFTGFETMLYPARRMRAMLARTLRLLRGMN